jgi:hypothetical protein
MGSRSEALKADDTVIYSSSPFSRFTKWTARATGHPAAFMAAALIVVVWGVTVTPKS